MKAPHKVISLLLGTILLLLTLGIPVYQVHCACNGSTEVSLLVTPEICEDQHNQCCSDQHKSQHCDADALVVNSHHCDNVQINYLVFDEIQDVVAPPAIIKSTFAPLAFHFSILQKCLLLFCCLPFGMTNRFIRNHCCPSPTSLLHLRLS